MDGPIRTYGDESAAVVVVRPGEEAGLARSLAAAMAATARPVRIVVADSRAGGPALDADDADVLPLGEDVRVPAAVNRAVAGLGTDVGWVAVSWAGAVWGAGAVDALLDAAAQRPRAGVLGPAVASAARGRRPGVLAALLRPRDPWPPRRGRNGDPDSRAVDPDSRAAHPDSRAVDPDSRAVDPDSRAVDPDSRGVGEGAVLLRRAAFDSVDGFDLRFPALAVLDLARRLDRTGWLVVPVPDVVVEGAGARPTGRHGEVRRYLAERHPGVLRAPLRAALRATAAPS